MSCKQCSKQYTCNKKECKEVKWSNTKNYGIVERRNNDKNR